MCELFCFNSKTPKRLNEDLRCFYKHSQEHPHGWGIAYMESGQFVIDKEPVKAISSDNLNDILSRHIITEICFAHIRLATMGKINSCNCHPFVKNDNDGRTWLLMHNGTIFDHPLLDKYANHEKGGTDSERVLCYIIDKINDFSENSLEDRFNYIVDIIEDLSVKNKVNLMIFDGDLTYVHTNMKDSLYYHKSDNGYMIASSPINDEAWKPVDINKVFALKDGEILFESRKHDYEFVFTKEHEEFFNDYLDSLRGEKLNENILSKIPSNELLEGLFGIEWESLRVKRDGKLALTPHPKVFGDKLKNPFVTTDFSESQVEIITPTFETVEEAFNAFSVISDVVNDSLPDDEYLWFQSIPAILPVNSEIPIAQYSNEGKQSQIYRENLADKYGLKKQMISGVHFNFSFTDDLIEKLHEISNSKLPLRLFKDELYLKITRNYLRYCWMIIYLTGCSVASHETFSEEFKHLMNEIDNKGSYYSTQGPSFRNGSCGYKNLKRLYPSYKSIFQFVHDINSFIDNGDLSEAKELYTQIRLKPENPNEMLDSLMKDGIKYVEIRTLDINPFYKCGLVQRDMKFLQLFLIYMLVKEESDYENWQKEAFINEERTAERAYDESMRLLKDGCEITFKDWALELIGEMYDMCDVLGFEAEDILNMMYDRILNPDLTYAKAMLRLIEEDGYIDAHMNLSASNKKTSIELIRNMDEETLNNVRSKVLYIRNS